MPVIAFSLTKMAACGYFTPGIRPGADFCLFGPAFWLGLLCRAGYLSFLRRKGGQGWMEMQALRQALLILSRRARRPPNLAVGGGPTLDFGARWAPGKMEPHLPTQLAVVLNRGRGGAEAKCWIQQIARRGVLRRDMRGCAGSFRRLASCEAARNRWRVPHGKQAEEIPSPLFSVEKTMSRGIFLAYALAARNFACSRSASLGASRGKNSSSLHGTRTAGFPPYGL